MPSSYSVVKSFPALPIQQSKAVTIALSVVNHASGLSEAPMNVRLLAGSQSSHAPHPAQLRCLNDLGVFLAAFPQRVETREEVMKICVLCETHTTEVTVVDNYYLCLDNKACAARMAELALGGQA